MIDAPRRMRKRSRKASSERGGESLLRCCTVLLLAAKRPVTEDALSEVAASAPRSMKDALLGSCFCSPCVMLLIEMEGESRGGPAYSRFVTLIDFFFDEVPSWSILRRAAEEEGLARLLGVEADSHE
jgi:hypothetical protein